MNLKIILPGGFLLMAMAQVACTTREERQDTTVVRQESTPANPSVPAPVPPPGSDSAAVPVTDTYSTRGPQDIVRSVLRQANGRMWMAGWEGLIAYNDVRFTNFTLLHGLDRAHMFSLLEDSKNYLWAGTVGAGVYFLDGRVFQHLTTQDGLPDNRVLTMLEDRQGHIWLGTGKGLSRYDGSRFTNFTMGPGVSENSINALSADKEGTIWIGTDAGLYFMPAGAAAAKPFARPNGMAFTNVRSLLSDKAGMLWIGSQQGLDRLDPLYPEKVDTWAGPGHTGNVFQDSRGRIWLSHSGKARGQMMLSLVQNAQDAALPMQTVLTAGQVFGVAEDKRGSIWVGTDKGVLQYDGKAVHPL